MFKKRCMCEGGGLWKVLEGTNGGTTNRRNKEPKLGCREENTEPGMNRPGKRRQDKVRRVCPP